MHEVRIRLLARFGVSLEGTEVPSERFGGRRTRSLIAFLATRRGSLIPKDVLIDILWGNSPPADPSGNLDVLTSRARRALGDRSLISAASGGVLLVDDARIEVDAERLADAVVQGRNYLAADQPALALPAFHEALDLWGDPLPNETYSDWAEPFRREMSALRQESLEGGARAALTLGSTPVASELAERAVAADPLSEVANLLLVTALGLGGNQVGALQAFDRYRIRLRDELGLDPSSEAFDLQSRILRGVKQRAVAILGELVPEVRLEDPRVTHGRRGSGPMRARTLASMAMLAAGSDDYRRASELVDLALAEADDDERALAEALYAASIVDMNLGLLERSGRRADDALARFESLGDDDGVANILDGKAMTTFVAGRIAEGVAAFNRVARLFTEAGNLARVITPRSTRGHGLVFMAKPEEGLAEVEQALEVALSLGDREGEAYARWHRSEALSALRRADEALESARASLDIAEEIAHREWTVAALRALAIAERTSGDLPAAEETHRRGLVASEGILLFRTWHAAGLAQVLLETGRPGEAHPFVEEAVGGGPPLALYEARLAQVRLAEATGDPRADKLAAGLRRDADEAGHYIVAAACAGRPSG